MIRREKRGEIKTNPPHPAKRHSKGKPVEFRLDAPEAEAVYLADEFNSWDPYSLPMKKGKDGIWKAKTKLPPGRYEYKLMADRMWIEDLPETERVANPFGTKNFIVRVE